MTQSAHLLYRHKPFIGSSHTWAVERCESLPSSAQVLDIGSGSGAIGLALKERGIGGLSAVEVDPAAREHARSIYSRVGTDLAEFRTQKFDLILLLDVLEHLTDPQAFLTTASELLTTDGRILISVPNVAHWSVRFPLLFGFFWYTERGILDQTHFQFFTRRRLRQLIKKVPSLEIMRLTGSISPAEFVLPRWIWNSAVFLWWSRVRLFFANAFPGLLAYQHLAEVKKVE